MSTNASPATFEADKQACEGVLSRLRSEGASFWDIAVALYELATIVYAQGKLDAALGHLLEARRLLLNDWAKAKQVNQPGGLFFALAIAFGSTSINAGKVLARQGNFLRAQEMLQVGVMAYEDCLDGRYSAIDAESRLDYQFLLALALFYLGNVLSEQGKLEHAQKRWQEAAKLFQLLGDEDSFITAVHTETMYKLGCLWVDQGDYARGAAELEATLARQRSAGAAETGTPGTSSQVSQKMSEQSCSHMSATLSALAYAHYGQFKDAEDQDQAATTTPEAAAAKALKVKALSTARQRLEEALALDRTLPNDKEGLVHDLLQIGHVLVKQSEVEDAQVMAIKILSVAEHRLQEAVALARTLPTRELYEQALPLLERVLLRQGKADEARQLPVVLPVVNDKMEVNVSSITGKLSSVAGLSSVETARHVGSCIDEADGGSVSPAASAAALLPAPPTVVHHECAKRQASQQDVSSGIYDGSGGGGGGSDGSGRHVQHADVDEGIQEVEAKAIDPFARDSKADHGRDEGSSSPMDVDVPSVSHQVSDMRLDDATEPVEEASGALLEPSMAQPPAHQAMGQGVPPGRPEAAQSCAPDAHAPLPGQKKYGHELVHRNVRLKIQREEVEVKVLKYDAISQMHDCMYEGRKIRQSRLGKQAGGTEVVKILSDVEAAQTSLNETQPESSLLNLPKSSASTELLTSSSTELPESSSSEQQFVDPAVTHQQRDEEHERGRGGKGRNSNRSNRPSGRSRRTRNDQHVTDLEDLMRPLIGMDKLKGDLRAFKQKIEDDQAIKAQGKPIIDPVYHMALIGNPGTGKTTVARLLHKMFCSVGVLSHDAPFVEFKPSHAEGSYLGEARDNVRNIINKARGGVLFADEAHKLTEDKKNTYGMQAASELMDCLQDKDSANGKESVIVIYAGYEQGMDKFFKSDPGYTRRVPNRFVLPDYSPTELARMFIEKALANERPLVKDVTPEAIATLIAEHTDETYRSNLNGSIAEKLLYKTEEAMRNRVRPVFTDLTYVLDDVIAAACQLHAT